MKAMRQRLSHFAIEQRESSHRSTSSSNNSIIIINSRYFIECLLWTRHCLKCFTRINFRTSLRSAIITLILQMRKLRPERLRNLPKDTQLVDRRARFKLRLQCCRDHQAVDKKPKVLDSCSHPIVFLIPISVEVATCLHCCLHSAQL